MSIFWAFTDDLRRATRWASWLGEGVAWLTSVAGVVMIFGARVPVFGRGLTNSLWLVFIGWFLNGASVRSYRQIVIQDVLDGVPVATMMRREPPTVSPSCTIRSLVHKHIMGKDDHAFPILENGYLAGLVTLDDIRSVPRDGWDDTQVGQVMTSADELVAVTP